MYRLAIFTFFVASASLSIRGLASTTASTAASKPTLVDEILVSVGDEIVLLSDLQRAIRAATGGQTSLDNNGKLHGGTITEKEANKVFEQLIDQKVLALRIKEMNVTVSEEELESEIDNLLKSQNVTREQFFSILKNEGESYESYREEFKHQLETQRFIGRVIRPLVSVSEDEVRNAYLRSSTGNVSATVKLRSLVLNFSDSLTPQQQQEKKNEISIIQKELKNGADFVSLISKFSDDKESAKNQGNLPPRPLNELPKELQSELKNAKQNDVVGPIKLASSTFFFQYLGREINNTADFNKKKSQIESEILESKFQDRLKEYLRAERSKTKISKIDFQIIR